MKDATTAPRRRGWWAGPAVVALALLATGCDNGLDGDDVFTAPVPGGL